MYNFKEMPAYDAMVIKQSLYTALASAREISPLFPTYWNFDSPTPGQAALAEEILLRALNNEYVVAEDTASITKCLEYCLECLRMLKTDNSDEQLMRMLGINFDERFENTLEKYVKMHQPKEGPVLYDLTGIQTSFIEKLDEFRDFVEATINMELDLIMDHNPAEGYPDLSKFDLSIELYGRKYILPSCAAVSNGLLDFIKFIKEEV